MHLTVTDDRSHRSDPEARNNFYIDVFIYNNSHYQKIKDYKRAHTDGSLNKLHSHVLY